MSTGCKSSDNGFLDVSRSNGGLSISGWIGQLSCLTIFSTSLSVAAFLRRAGGSMLESTGSHGRGVERRVPTMKLPYALHIYQQFLWRSVCSWQIISTVKELLNVDNICKSYVQMKKGSVFLTRSVGTICKFANYSLYKFILKISSVDKINCLCLFYYQVYLWSVFFNLTFFSIC